MNGSLDVAAWFAQNLKRCRRRSGLSQEELAYRAGLHRTAISLLERGARTPRADTIVRLAGGLEVPAGELLDGLEWTPGRVEVTEGRFEVETMSEDP